MVEAGALMAAMIAIPLSGIASADFDPNDDLPYIAPVEATTYPVEDGNGLNANFELVERNGEMMLVLFVDETVFGAPEDE